MAGRVAIDFVPGLGQPAEVAKGLTEATELRDRAREAVEDVAAAQSAVDEVERQDVESAAQRARSGEPLGQVPAVVKKAREQLEMAKRNSAALALALQGCEDDLIDVLAEQADPWIAELDNEVESARERAAQALAAFESALGHLTDATSTSLWLRTATEDGRWDRPTRIASAGTVAPSSARLTKNDSPLDRAALLGYCHELVEPPAPRPVLHAQTSE